MAYSPKVDKRGVWKAVCDVCGFTFNSDELKKRWDGYMVCNDDWEPRNILDFFKPVKDNMNIPWSRPWFSDFTNYDLITSTDSPYTLTVAIYQLDVDATSGNITINLPLANTYTFAGSQGLSIRRTDGSANTVTVQRQGADTINGTTSETIPANGSKVYQNDAVSKWMNF